ncbi:tubulin epsilon chain isoform X2 [Cephus cinctus]|uniref:Tubulin epsilon chain isoform X2 n=1 Tax=Cephus cinctus TaxID=211228 RepID=A0AAJ7RRP0_CEPCN|nr:tubulin epsilon chain isoform X2 [Cephus cinctus]
MSQFITIQVGQCGNQIGAAFWPLALHEYGIQTSSGGVNLLKIDKNHMKNTKDLADAFHSFFHVPHTTSDLSFKTLADLNAAKVKARAILIDMEDSVVARFKCGPLRTLFDHSCTVTNYPGSGNNWAVGHYTHGTEYFEKIDNTIRRVAEKCDRLHGFVLVNSLGGGTGSGLGTATLKQLDDNYPHVDRFVSSVYPAENKALLEICNVQMDKKENIDQGKYNATCKPFQDMNSVIVNMLLHVTSGSRFPGTLNTDMNELATNLVPYPRMHYIFSSVSPVALTAPSRSIVRGTRTHDELFTSAWSRSNQLIKVDPLRPGSVIIGAAHIVRGNSSLTNIRRNIERFQDKAKFTSWSRDVMKVGLCSVPPAGHSTSVMCLMNSTAVSSMLRDIVHQFDQLYRRKAHVHHYLQVDGFDKTTFEESKESILSLSDHYKEIQNQQPLNIPRMKLVQ